MKRRVLGPIVALVFGVVATAAAPPKRGFSFKDTPGKHMDVLRDGKIVARYMYAYDTSTKELQHETYKPYLHVFDAAGTMPITKGAGGQYTHHRGIFIGWKTITVAGQKYDRWHMKDGAQVHQKFLKQEASGDSATLVSLVHWHDREKKPILEEERKFEFRVPPKGAHFLLDFSSTIKATVADVELNGDPEHAGIQYRPANEVDRKATTYYFPGEEVNLKTDRDLPWVGETYSLKGKEYSVVIMSHPDNPKGTRWSAYRDYGRFGAFPVEKVAKGASRTFLYRFLVGEGEMFPVGLIQETCNAFTGASDPAPKMKAVGSKAKGKK